jgi:hypothetical protein
MRTFLAGDDRLHGLDCVAALITLLLSVFVLCRLCVVDDPREPFAEYDSDPVIRLIWTAAALADLALAGAVVAWAVRPVWIARAQLTIVLAATIAGLLPLVELWWGDDPRYSGVRDKQELPWTAIHWGPIGTVFFAMYLLLRVKIPARGDFARARVRVGLILVLWSSQPSLLRALKKTWHF